MIRTHRHIPPRMARHERTLKFSVGRQHTDGQEDRAQALLQLQLFCF